ncbi:MAG TPA: hypothetical protein DD435_02435 [Cyanobacteria bacterium UBA8530]|nr:hypothetical protein [Cyanobacteria bacterium UBA8530]
MFKKIFTLLSTTCLLASSLSGCGIAPVSTSLSGASSGLSILKKTFKHGLGCNLDGMKKLTESDSYEIQAALPEKIDLRSGCSPITNQGVTNACVGFASVDGLAEFVAKKQGHPMDFAPRYIWNLSRKQDKSLDQNIGTHIYVATERIDNMGLVAEEAFPFPSDKEQADEKTLMKFVSEAPPNALIAQAKKNRIIKGWKQIASVHAMKKSLSDGMPVVFAIAVFDNIAQSNSTGNIPLPTEKSEVLGGHAIVCVGYDNAKKVFIIRNSWGTAWGDKGYGYLPYEFVKIGATYEGFTAKI